MADKSVAQTLQDALNSPSAPADVGDESEDTVVDPKAEAKETAMEAEDSDTEATTVKSIPYDRFKEVIDAKNTAAEEAEALRAKLDETRQREDQLRNVLEQTRDEADLVDRIRALANDERYSEHVNAIDRALRGIEDDVDTGKVSEEEGAVAANKLLSQHKDEIEDILADQKAELLYNQAMSVAERYLEALPEEYSDDEKAVISRLWMPQVDWDAIEEEPTTMTKLLGESLQEAIDQYGEPRGVLHARLSEIETTEADQEPAREEISEEDYVNKVLNVPWDETNEDGSPKYSDDVFTKGIGELIRKTRGA